MNVQITAPFGSSCTPPYPCRKTFGLLKCVFAGFEERRVARDLPGKIDPMTLILALVSQHFAVMVADRRLTLPGGGFYDDDSNKMIIFKNRMAFAYTGIAN